MSRRNKIKENEEKHKNKLYTRQSKRQLALSKQIISIKRKV